MKLVSSKQLAVSGIVCIAVVLLFGAFTFIPNHYPVNRDGLVAWYSYRNTGSISATGTWKDYSGNENDGTLFSIAYVDNSGLNVPDGSYINCGNDTSLDMSSSFSIALYMKRSSTGGYSTLVSKRQSGGVATNYEIGLNGSNNLYFYNGSDIKNSTWNAIIDTPYHIVTTFESGTFRLYVDGNLEYSVSATLGSPNTYDLFIGSFPSFTQHYIGIIDDIQIYNRALSAGEVKQLYLKNKRN